jgi:hypothetical protein
MCGSAGDRARVTETCAFTVCRASSRTSCVNIQRPCAYRTVRGCECVRVFLSASCSCRECGVPLAEGRVCQRARAYRSGAWDYGGDLRVTRTNRRMLHATALASAASLDRTSPTATKGVSARPMVRRWMGSASVHSPAACWSTGPSSRRGAAMVSLGAGGGWGSACSRACQLGLCWIT